MNNKPLISIIVPVYNVEKYLARCLDSILAQTLADFEVIAVDDGSPDNCGKILDEYAKKDNRIKVIHKENGGVSSARNAGLDEAMGEYIGFVDPDDYISCDMYEHLYNEAKSGDYDIVQCNNYFVDNRGNEKRFLDHIKNTEYADTDDMICAFFDNNIRCCAWNKIFKRQIIADTRFLKELRIAEDKLFVYNCLHNASKVKTTEKYCYFYCQSETSVIHSGINEKKFDELKVLDILEKDYKNNPKVSKSLKKHLVEINLNIIFSVLGSRKYFDKLPELIRRLTCLKATVLLGCFTVKEKIFTLMLSVAPKSACRLTSAYLNRKR